MKPAAVSPILAWLANGYVGLSSKTMAMTALGVHVENVSHPHDPDDLNRCLLLLKAAPEVRDAFPKIAALSPAWAALIKHWDEIEQSFIGECGLDWSKSANGRNTYALMRRIIDSANETVVKSGGEGMSLSAPQQSLYDAMKAGVICRWMPYMGRFGGAYYFRNDTHARCTKQAQALLARGLVEIFDRKSNRGHILRVKTISPGGNAGLTSREQCD